jgi:hypothetical protein
MADTHAHVQRLVSTVKMGTVLEECTTEEQRSIVRILWAKWLNARSIYREMFSVYDGKCLSRKAVHNWVDKFSQGYSKVATDNAQPGCHFQIATEATVQRVEELI